MFVATTTSDFPRRRRWGMSSPVLIILLPLMLLLCKTENTHGAIMKVPYPKFSTIPSYASDQTKQDLANLRTLSNTISDFGVLYFETGPTVGPIQMSPWFWKKALELTASPFCFVQWYADYLKNFYKILTWIDKLISAGRAIPKVKYLCRKLKPLQTLIDKFKTGYDKLDNKCKQSQRVGKMFATTISWFDTFSWPIVYIFPWILFSGHELTRATIEVIDFFENDVRRRRLGQGDNGDGDGYNNSTTTTTGGESAYHDLKLALKSDTSMSLQARKTTGQLLRVHSIKLKNMTTDEFIEVTNMEKNRRGRGRGRRLGYNPTPNPDITGMINAMNAFNTSLENLNSVLTNPTLMDAYTTAQSVVSDEIEPLVNSTAMRTMSNFIDKHHDFFKKVDLIVNALSGLSCPDNLRFLCDLDGLALDWIESQLPFDVDDFVSELLSDLVGFDVDFSAIADRIPDLETVFDIDALTAEFRTPFPAAGNVMKAMEFDIFDGMFDKSGIDDVNAFGGLELRMASSKGGSTLNIDCQTKTNGQSSTGETPLVVNAWYRTLNCFDSNDDFAPKVVRPCGTAQKCTVDASHYVHPACSPDRTNTRRNSRWTAALELTGTAEPSLEWYGMYYTCVTETQLDEIDYLPSLVTQQHQPLRCSAGESVAIDAVLWSDPCTDTGIVNGGDGMVEFNSQVSIYCKYSGITRTNADLNEDALSILFEGRNTTLWNLYNWGSPHGFMTTDCTDAGGGYSFCWPVLAAGAGREIGIIMNQRLYNDTKCAYGGGRINTTSTMVTDCIGFDVSTVSNQTVAHIVDVYRAMMNQRITLRYDPFTPEWQYLGSDIPTYFREKPLFDQRMQAGTSCVAAASSTCQGAPICDIPICSTFDIQYACLVEGRDFVNDVSENKVNVAIGFTDGETDDFKKINVRCPSTLLVETISIEYGSGIAVTTVEQPTRACNNAGSCTAPASYYVPGGKTVRFNYQCVCDGGYHKEQRLNASTGELFCEAVEAGRFRARSMLEPEDCAAGSYSPGTVPGSFPDWDQSCTLCRRGTFSSLEGSTSCLDCPAGYYQDELGQATCIPCPAHSVAPDTGSRTCSPCAHGLEAPGLGNTVCVEVDVGHISISPTTGRRLNPVAGGVQTGSGPIPCDKGTYSPTTGAGSCLECPAGQYASEEGSSACTLCPVNTYSPYVSSQACIACPEGHITSFSGQQSVDDCFVPTTGFVYDPVTDSSKTCDELLMFDVDETTTDDQTRQNILTRRQAQKGNGYCNGGPWNTPQCEYDGGDCCASTCTIPPEHGPEDENDLAVWKNACEPKSFVCIDPIARGETVPGEFCAASTTSNRRSLTFYDETTMNSNTSIDASSTKRQNNLRRSLTVSSSTSVAAPGDGICDGLLNNVENNYDGGDCCEETCTVPTSGGTDSAEYACMRPWIQSLCIDPSFHNDATSAPGNGRCDEDLNTAQYNYDGGDCCWQTCIPRVGVAGDCLGLTTTCRDPDIPLNPTPQTDTADPILISSVDINPHVELVIGSSFPDLPDLPVVVAVDNDPCFDGDVDFEETGSFQCPLTSSTVTRTWTAIDRATNDASLTQVITLKDDVPPTLIGDFTDETVVYSDSPWPQAVTSTDNDPCYVSGEEITPAEETILNCNVGTGGPPERHLVRTWTARDASNNLASEIRTLTVIDDIAPELVPWDGFNFTAYNNRITKQELEELKTVRSVTATDEGDPCTIDSEIVVTFTEVEPDLDNACLSLKPQVVWTWSAQDMTGNTVEEQVTMNLYDGEKPVLVFDSTNMEYSDGAVIELPVSYYIGDLPTIPSVTAKDNDPCFDGSDISYVQKASTVCGSPNGMTFVVRSWTVSDASGNVATVNQTFYVYDDQPPVLSGDFSEKLDVESNQVLTPQPVTGTDADPCYDEIVTFSENIIVPATAQSTTCPDNYTIERTWNSTDPSGLQTSQVETIHVVDTTPPETFPNRTVCVYSDYTKGWIRQSLLTDLVPTGFDIVDDCRGNNKYCNTSATARISSCTSSEASTSKRFDNDCLFGGIDVTVDGYDDDDDGSSSSSPLPSSLYLYLDDSYKGDATNAEPRSYLMEVSIKDNCDNVSKSYVEMLLVTKKSVGKDNISVFDSMGCDSYITIDDKKFILDEKLRIKDNSSNNNNNIVV